MKLREGLKAVLWAAFGAGAVTAFGLADHPSQAGGNEAHVVGYVWANSPSTKQYNPDPNYQFNLTHGVNSIRQEGPGTYEVRFPNLKSNSGNVQVTAYGGGSEHCKLVSWVPSANDLSIKVKCWAANGTPADSQFSLIVFN